jgi:N-acetylmuramoyl-L-alanine amidase/LysM repeat protein
MAAASVAGKTIVVDPGHGGKDPGAIANNVQEKTITLPIGLQLASILQAEGANVVMTRASDVNPAPTGTVDDDLQARVVDAQQAKANAFVSIHGNESSDPNTSGSTTYYGPTCGFYSGVKPSPTDAGRSYSLAKKVQSAMVARTQARDDGTPASAFWVLGNPGIPAILVETGFLSNRGDAAKLVDPGYQHTVADAIADGLNAFFASGDATGSPSPPSEALVGCSGSAAKDDRSHTQAPPAPPEKWLQTFLSAPLLSGADPNSKQFTTLPPFTYLKQLDQSGGYFHVLNPTTNGPGYIDATKVGPSGPPPPPPPPFQPFWVESFRPTRLWSSPAPDAVNFGPLPTWSYLQVMTDSSDPRFFVRISATGNVAYVDRADVGPSGPPPDPAAAAPAPAPAPPAAPAPKPVAAPAPAPVSGSVVVAAGDTLSAISAKTGVSVADLIAANHLTPDGQIQIGQTLALPGSKAPATAAPRASAPAASGSVVVADGDTVSGIAARAGVSMADLIAANHLTPDGMITVGQKLVLPGGSAPAAASASSSKTGSITVAPGDTLSGIAARAGVSVQTLMNLNNLASADNLQAGQVLKVPAS